MSIEDRILAQNDEIEAFHNDTPFLVAKMLFDEALELVEELNKAAVTDDLTAVVSEIGDVYYLLVRLSDLLGIDYRQAAMTKLTRNAVKYGGCSDSSKAREN
jgi:NTP pyrophosphatase (non-canonical NTP hydrolase)